MTFTEAAAQVLRLVGKPLHYKEITDVAIEKDLLSHVGKSPEVTMGARLAALVKKGDKENPLVRIKPGVFALREWDPQTIEKGLLDRTPALKMLEDSDVLDTGGNSHVGAEAEASRPRGEPPSEGDSDDDEIIRIDEDERERAELAATASEMFAPEEDDDEPILAGDDEEEEDDEARPGEDRGEPGRRRRRRRRRGRGSGGGSDDLPTYTVSDAVVEPAPAPDSDSGEERPAARPQPQRDGGRDRESRDNREGRDSRDFAPRDAGPALDELDGLPLADAAVELLNSFERQGPVALRQLLDTARRRGRLAGDPQQALTALSAALRADNARREADGLRARFRFVNGRVGLTDWLLDGELRRLEREVTSAVERYREAMRRALLRRVQALPPRAIGELAIVFLERLGIADLQPVRRPGAPAPELTMSGKAPGPISPIQTALIVRRDGRDVGREQVTELRGSLHHFGPALAGCIVTTGQVLSGAREEASVAGASPVRLIDGATFARLCEEQGLLVTKTALSLPLPDIELFEALRSNGAG